MRKLFTSLLLLLMIFSLQAQQLNIVPKPKSIKQPRIATSFIITPATQIVLEGSNMTNAVNFFNDYLQRFYLFKLKVTKKTTSKNVIRLNYERMDNEIPGAYNMTVDGKGIYIAGDNEDGVFYGIQTLIQLLPVPEAGSKIRRDKLNIPYVAIEDAPRFAYRGMHLDCSRHFWPVDFVKQYIDYLALHKFNKFHWHLTDDQGWRIEIKKYPKLTAVGSWRNGTIIGRYPGTGNDGLKYGGYYTQEQIKEVVKYASDRYIDVIPEIEMPGHSSAAIAAYPELSCFPDEPTKKYFPKQCAWNGDSTGKQVQQTWGVFDDVFCAGHEKTFEFLKDVMDEVLSLFPSKYIHVGGDECPKENWKRCPHCQKRIKDNNLKDEHELQSYFIQRMEKYLNSKGRILIGWDEILEGGLAPNAVVMSWRGEAGGIEAAKQKHHVIMTPGNPVYFDHSQSENEDSVTIGGYNPVEKVYAYEPIPKELNGEEGKYVLGAQANLWCEYVKNTKKVEYMIFPRIAALSEVLWSKKEDKKWADFEKRLMTQFKRYDLWKANYSKAYYDAKVSIAPSTSKEQEVLLSIKSKSANTFFHGEFALPNASGLSGKFTPNPFRDTTIHIKQSGNYFFWILDNPDISKAKMLGMKEQVFRFNKATGKKIALEKQASKSYPGDGAFTLVNGVQNTKGMSKTKEFLGFSGEDCIATIDLGKEESISFVKVHYLHQPGSWIHQPSAVTISVSADGIDFSTVAISNPSIANNEAINEFLQPANTRYIKVHISNFGTIPSGNPGAGSKAWLFVDEIEIN